MRPWTALVRPRDDTATQPPKPQYALVNRTAAVNRRSVRAVLEGSWAVPASAGEHAREAPFTGSG